jgi:hypothetical protein
VDLRDLSIRFPAGNERKIFHLSRPFQKDSRVFSMTFQLYNRVAGKIEDSRSFPLPAASFAAHDATASAKAAVPRRAPGDAASAGSTVLREAGDQGAHTDAALDCPFIFEDIQTNTETLHFRIQNRNNIPVKIGAVSAKAKFFDGFDHDLNISCSAAEIAPGQDVRCTSPLQPARCPTFHRIDVSAVLNGKRLRGEMEIDAPVKAVESEPVIRLKKRKMDNCCNYGNGSGEAEVIVRGVYVRLGTQVTMKGIVNFDGAGAVIYRNGFNVSEWNGYVPGGNLFLLQRHCK